MPRAQVRLSGGWAPGLSPAALAGVPAAGVMAALLHGAGRSPLPEGRGRQGLRGPQFQAQGELLGSAPELNFSDWVRQAGQGEALAESAQPDVNPRVDALE